MKEKYIKLESVLAALYSNKRIGDNGDIDSKAITDILNLPTKEIETSQVNQDFNYNNWEDLLGKSKSSFNSYIPEVCRSCSNHPSNGGSGFCNRVLGTPQVMC